MVPVSGRNGPQARENRNFFRRIAPYEVRTSARFVAGGRKIPSVRRIFSYRITVELKDDRVSIRSVYIPRLKSGVIMPFPSLFPQRIGPALLGLVFFISGGLLSSVEAQDLPDSSWLDGKRRQEQTQLFLDFEFFPGPDEGLGTEDDVPTPQCNFPCYDLSTEYRGQRIIFETGTLSQTADPFFPDKPSDNHFVTSSPMSFDLFLPAYSLIIDSFSAWGVQISAFDVDDQLVASATFENSGSEIEHTTLELHSPTPFQKVIIIASTCEAEPTVQPTCEEILNLDDLHLGFQPGSIFFDSFETGDMGRWVAQTSMP